MMGEGVAAPPVDHNKLTIARKPVPASSDVQATSVQGVQDGQQHHSAPAWTGRLRRRWAFMPLWQKITAVAVPVALVVVALTLGLAIGLTRGHGQKQNLPLPSNHGGPYTGDLTYYAPGLGACGVTSSSSDNIVAISHRLFDAAQTGTDPNANALCGKKMRAKRYKEGVGERSVDLTVVDRCVACQATDIDVTTTAFERLADLDLGRVSVSWSWLD
ncbi:hypothetical protein DV737_g3011, partial [Chaetothyriales sp. CBS 132003]